MKSDLQTYLAENQFEAVLVTGAAQHNSSMVYLTGGGHITQADLIVKRGEQGVLFCNSMEREEAARTGLITRGYDAYPMRDLLQEAGGDRVKASALRYKKMLVDCGVTRGRVALYGKADAGTSFHVFSWLQKLMPELELVSDPEGAVLQRARLTKDADEIERIRAMGRVTVEVVGRTADYLKSHRVEAETLVDADGKPLTLGKVKGKINLWLAELGAENPEGTIFAIGRDAGVPHSTGNATDPIRLGQTLVYDIFPCEAGGGYFYDFTRTWCVGYASDEVLALYENVRSVYDQVVAELQPGVVFGEYQRLTCQMFEAMGHPTVLNSPATEEGYVHSLGHGLGLDVHERPFSGAFAAKDDVLLPGSVFTIEPGLYYPSRGMGVRLEDTYFVNANNRIEKMVDYPLDLILKV